MTQTDKWADPSQHQRRFRQCFKPLGKYSGSLHSGPGRGGMAACRAGRRGGRAAVTHSTSPAARHLQHVTYGSATAGAWVLLTPLCLGGVCFLGKCHYMNGLSALGSTRVHPWMGQKYCAHSKKGSTIRRAFIILMQGIFIHPLRSFPYWWADLFTLLSHWL